MSKPQNPLNCFRTYAYHHILIACDGTDSANALINGDDTMFMRQPGAGKYEPRSAGGGKYVILINGMTDTEFIIRTAKWANVYQPREDTSGESQVAMMALDGELKIEEPLGVQFFQLLDEVMAKLETSAASLLFVLKTIFVGHTYQNETVPITNVRALVFFMIDMSAMFDETGAQYIISFVGVTNGMSRLAPAEAGFGGFKMNAPTTETDLKTFIEGDFKTEVNNQYKQWKTVLKDQAPKDGVTLDFDKDFFDVEYDFEVDEAYNTCKVAGNALKMLTDTGQKDVQIAGQGNNQSAEAILDFLMRTSKEVIAESPGNGKDGKRYVHKITSTTKITGSGASKKYTVIYHVHRYEVVMLPPLDYQNFTPEKFNSSGIEFDYIFTGKNIDIESFDLKMQMGLAFFQTLASHSSLPINSAVGLGGGIGYGGGRPGGSGEPDGEPKRRRPLFMAADKRDPYYRTVAIPAATATYQTLLDRHAALENLEARLVIHGNLQLLEDTSYGINDFDIKAKPKPPQTFDFSQYCKGGSGGAQGVNVFKEPGKHPAYVKVNVMMPKKTSKDLSSSDFAEPFWYSGWYMILSVNNVFDDGKFTQEITMVSLPVDSTEGNLGKSVDSGSGGATIAGSTGTTAAPTTPTTSPQNQPAGATAQDVATQKAELQKVIDTISDPAQKAAAQQAIDGALSAMPNATPAQQMNFLKGQMGLLKGDPKQAAQPTYKPFTEAVAAAQTAIAGITDSGLSQALQRNVSDTVADTTKSLEQKTKIVQEQLNTAKNYASRNTPASRELILDRAFMFSPNTMMAPLQGGMNQLTGMTNQLTGQLPLMTNQLTGMANQLPLMANQLTGQLSGLTGQLSGVTGQLSGQLSGLTSQLPTLSGQLSNVAGQLPTQLSGMSSQLAGLTGQLPRLTNQLAGGLTNQLQGMAGQLTGQMSSMAGQISGLAQLPGNLSGALNQLPNQMSGVVGQVAGQIQGTAQQLTGLFGGIDNVTMGGKGDLAALATLKASQASVKKGRVQDQLNQLTALRLLPLQVKSAASLTNILQGLPQNMIQEIAGGLVNSLAGTALKLPNDLLSALPIGQLQQVVNSIGGLAQQGMASLQSAAGVLQNTMGIATGLLSQSTSILQNGVAMLQNIPATLMSQLPLNALQQLPMNVLSRMPVDMLSNIPVNQLMTLPQNMFQQAQANILSKMPINQMQTMTDVSQAFNALGHVAKTITPTLSNIPTATMADMFKNQFSPNKINGFAMTGYTAKKVN